MTDSLVLRGGTIIDARGSRRADVLVGNDGTIEAVGEDLSSRRTLDAEGCIVSPGFVDLHTHLRQPGNEDAETIETASRAGALGGYTALVAMPDTTPAMDCASVVRDVLSMGRAALTDIIAAASITVGRKGAELSPMAELAELGVRIFTDDGSGVQDDMVMKRALEYSLGLAPFTGGGSVVLAQHCDVLALSQGGFMHEGEGSSRLGIPGQPAVAEELMVMRDLALARVTGARLHLQHLSTARSIELVRAAKAEGIAVTAEATTHHFTLTDSCCDSFDTVYKVNPPLRPISDVEAVRAGLGDGTIDAIATDHAPHAKHQKERPFDSAPPGMLGLETALALAVTELDLPIETVIGLMSWRPAQIAGSDLHGRPVEAGQPANLCVFDPQEQWTIDASALASKSRNCPYEGRSVRGKVRHTILHGEAVVVDSEATR
ncbi:MAG: dihydroorotase [Acidimicrobiales bacterium]